MNPDFGATAQDYARHRAGFPESFFGRVGALGFGRPGQRVVDLGTGTGSLARWFARRGCVVTGIDISEAMLAEARRLDRDEPEATRPRYLAGRAESTGLAPGCADIVSAGQCWHWFDGRLAAAEASRLLVPEGRILIAHLDWIPLEGNIVRATEELIEQFNPDWTMGNGLGLHPKSLRDLGESGFVDIETFSHDAMIPYTAAAWRGRMRASAGVGASLPATAVAAFDDALARLLASRYPGADDLIGFPHRVFAVTARRPS